MSIVVTDQTTPIVIFWGPQACGKSMILVRLSQYLQDVKHYTVRANDTLVNSAQYRKDCEIFDANLSAKTAVPGTTNYLLADVLDENQTKRFQLLEAPGEDFFSINEDKKSKNEEEVSRTLPEYLLNIIDNPNQKIFVVLLDLYSESLLVADHETRQHYEKKIIRNFDLNNAYDHINQYDDRLILVLNKVDAAKVGDLNSCNEEAALELAKQMYPKVFDKLKKRTLCFNFENFKFLPFCTGRFSQSQDQNGKTVKTYTPSSDYYPELLWKEISKRF